MSPLQNTPFRSADMSMVQLFVYNEISREVVTALGELGLCQFRDLNEDVSAFQRTFTQEIRRLQNVAGYFFVQIEKAGMMVHKLDLNDTHLASPSASEIDELVERSQKLEQQVSSLSDSYEALQELVVSLTEWRWVLREAGSFFDRTPSNMEGIRTSLRNDGVALLSDVGRHSTTSDVERSFSGMSTGFVAGVISRDRIATYERILWRTLRGNLYMRQSEILEPLPNPTTNEIVKKKVFLVFAHGEENVAKVRKISVFMGAGLYDVNEDYNLRGDQIQEVNNRFDDVQSVLRNTRATLEAELHQISQSLSAWMVLITKEKAIYTTLNLFSFDPARRILIAEGWCPTNDFPLIRSTLRDVTNQFGISTPSLIKEAIVDAYGTATYQEVNPAVHVIVTFPFLFAVMFGDFGHAVTMLAAALTMIYWEKPLQKITFDLFAMVFYGRYIMLVLAAFSLFTGLIYNDTFSKSLTLFDSAWMFKKPEGWRDKMVVSATLNSDGYRHPFGLDWAWHGAENELVFNNSYKMKMSIVLGWAHMTYSLCYAYINARHFKKPIDLWGNFIPEMIFFQAIFGYLVMCIIYKWSVDWLGTGAQPPGLLNMLIYMFLQPGTLDERLYSGQGYVQVTLLCIAFAQVPILLFLKPFYLRRQHNRARAQGYRGDGETSVVSGLDRGDESRALMEGQGNSFDEDDERVAVITQNIDEDPSEFEFGEVMIHQVIHTIGNLPLYLEPRETLSPDLYP
ncbi:URE2 protein [Metarhizium robertsii ARSEF 23]|uniref:V-type proton ATPase subunit a n=1 Tax=Metarhizium robertsii (strain ARSEF 23 / ATCC MYA-3075) TaxID=655844 RepID=A0A0B2XEF8_METRA|nr:URE2 protein [Metarhizium robertsii ARSEF 23]KHO11100.1 URE2 protein [Metarhizium robertsii ARSEF 23]